MPIQEPRLDDLGFDRIVEELRRRIPVYAPEWTDHNDSDPGITLIQLFAYLAEQVGYRLNRVPEKNSIELLKLLGVHLQPALASHTRLAMLLDDPSKAIALKIRAGARAKAKAGQPPPSFETDADLDLVPAEMTLLLVTKNPYLTDVLLLDAAGNRETPPVDPPKMPRPASDWLTVAWDGKKPKLKEMPVGPIRLVPSPGQRYLWIGLLSNLAPDAGFRGVRVTLSLQFDDDEQPSLTAVETCGPKAPAGETPTPIDWLWYFDPSAPSPGLKKVGGRIDDTTSRFTRSGELRFTVPFGIGPIPDDAWKKFREPGTVDPIDACLTLGSTLKANLSGLVGPALLDSTIFSGALASALTATEAKQAQVKPEVAHPLDPQLRASTKVNAWLRIELPDAILATGKSPMLRMISFNVVPATNANTIRNERLGVANGTPGQTLTLRHGNVLADTLQLAVQEDPDPSVPLVTWVEKESLDDASPFDRVFALDREAGVITFGDGTHGRIVPLVPGGGNIVAQSYRYGGGVSGELDVGQITKLETPAQGVSDVVNVVAATGGKDSETLDQAKIRARKEISTRSRAVTATDFEFLALQTPEVRVKRVVVVPLRKPLPSSATVSTVGAPRCGPLPTGAAGLDTTMVPGAVSVVVVPDETGPEPVPTPSFLQAVCRQLDGHRLVTTEVHVVPPQYFRLCNIQVEVKGRPGYTRSQIQDLVVAKLSTYLHPITGGEDGTGYPFGSQVHISDLMAQVFRTEGVERVERFQADFSRTKSNAVPRQGMLVLCPSGAGQFQKVTLAPEECPSFDASKFTLSTVA